MRFQRMILENWRNFRSAEVELDNRAFMLGPNAVGKSNFLDAFRFLRDLVLPGGGLEKAVLDRGGISRVRCLAARQSPNIVIDVTIGDGDQPSWRYRIAVKQDNQRRPMLGEERVWQSETLILQRPNADDEQDEERLHQTFLQQVNANQAFREITEFLRTVRYWHVVPQLVRETDRSIGKHNDPFGGDFLEQIQQTPARTRDARLRWITEVMKIAVPQMVELHAERDQHGVPHLKGRYAHWRSQGSWQNEADFSDGTLRLIGLLWALLDGNGPLLLEEPELSLHNDVVRSLPQMMAKIQSQSRRPRQIILSTHDADLLSDPGIESSEVVMFTPSSEGSSVEIASHSADIRNLLASGLPLVEAILPRIRAGRIEQLMVLGEQPAE